MNLEKVINKASNILKNSNINSHELDAQIILSDILGVTKEFLLTNDNLILSRTIKNKYDFAIKRRAKKEPVAYILGKKEFWSQNFKVNKSTLVPRPETELMIYKVVKTYINKKINILDIGTGSGCILLSILKELKNSRGIGIDISPKAIKVAKENSKDLNLLNRAKFKTFDIKKFNSGKFDLIISNPPYIPYKDIRNLSKDIISYEPISALNGGNDGLDLIKKVIYKSTRLLKKSGLLAIEIGTKQYISVSNLLARQGFKIISKEYDNKDNVRCIISTKVRFF
jgi:release factor glutamine methyltransferase